MLVKGMVYKFFEVLQEYSFLLIRNDHNTCRIVSVKINS
uniref:Uncharacterized protein n=1 Tax=Arundo donax TaxID=35708 RepID=A0A0A9GY68_ARUDO